MTWMTYVNLAIDKRATTLWMYLTDMPGRISNVNTSPLKHCAVIGLFAPYTAKGSRGHALTLRQCMVGPGSELIRSDGSVAVVLSSALTCLTDVAIRLHESVSLPIFTMLNIRYMLLGISMDWHQAIQVANLKPLAETNRCLNVTSHSMQLSSC